MRHFIFFILSLWFGLSFFIDIIAVPTLFRNISKLSEAGSIGMIFFSGINTFEVIASLLLISTASFWYFKKKPSKVYLVSGFILLSLSCTYKFYITPEITSLNQRKYSQALGPLELAKVEKRHQELHELYKKCDSFKLLLLLGLIIHHGILNEKKLKGLQV